MIEVAIGLLILAGGAFGIIASVGVLRLPDVLIRMHAATKIGLLSAGLILTGVALYFNDVGIVVRCAAIVLFLFLTAPIAAHMMGRAAVRLGVPMFRTVQAPLSRSAPDDPPRP
ncbi:monovalent cation/H(+) antiporter subunit G [Rubellimicrobium sp. CFH 75288]|uniref:monovalent cation/H(+) antiporter subunit G n=1 Tax=Rubellimicrobium sp. CFH 75288 TaxID=2697034 RepID=UPI00141285B7|nr:monovalent cation/H(+) antiporter subunit G [Rubellimicrobium sp. CFH 75288]NAZ35281.1 Na+/H+ antiporter subunit G [Rubellimicrobium sp. CFH 75288]